MIKITRYDINNDHDNYSFQTYSRIIITITYTEKYKELVDFFKALSYITCRSVESITDFGSYREFKISMNSDWPLGFSNKLFQEIQENKTIALLHSNSENNLINFLANFSIKFL